MKNDDGQSSQATKRIQFLQSRLRPWFRCHEDELSQTGYDSRNDAAGKRSPIFLLDRQHRTAIPMAGSILSAQSQSAAAQQDRKSVVKGKSVSVRVDHGGRRIIKHNTQ